MQGASRSAGRSSHLELALRRIAALEREAIRAALEVKRYEVRRKRLVGRIDLRQISATVWQRHE